MTEPLEQTIIEAVKALDLLGSEEAAEAELASLLRRTVGKPKERELILTVLRCCARLPVAEQYLQIEAEAQDYARAARMSGEHDGRRRSDGIVAHARSEASEIVWSATKQKAELAKKQEEVEKRLQEMIGPHAPALALLQSILSQYPTAHGERLPPAAFLSACALVASLMGSNPVDLSLQFSGASNFEFSGARGKRS